MPHRIVRSPEEDDRLVKLLDDGWVVNRIEKAILTKEQREVEKGEAYVLHNEVCEYLIVLERSR